jgi:hypothetical protein
MSTALCASETKGDSSRRAGSARHSEQRPISLWQITALVASRFLEDPPGRSSRRIFLSENKIRNSCGRSRATPGLPKSGRKWQDLRKFRAFVHQCTRGVVKQGSPGSSTDRQAQLGQDGHRRDNRGSPRWLIPGNRPGTVARLFGLYNGGGGGIRLRFRLVSWRLQARSASEGEFGICLCPPAAGAETGKLYRLVPGGGVGAGGPSHDQEPLG